MGEPNLRALKNMPWLKDEVIIWKSTGDRFVASGKIEDYLYYKGMSICEETINRYKEGDTIGKSDYTDWHDTDSSTDR